MKRLVVEQDFVGGWNVREADSQLQILYRNDRIRAEGFARRICSPEGGFVTVVGNNGITLAEYAAKGKGRASLPFLDMTNPKTARRQARDHRRRGFLARG